MGNSPRDELHLIGELVSHYKILEQLGEGGMGVVYRAEDTRLGRQAALKFLSRRRTLDEQARQRFVHEAQAASALDHENICTVYEINETDRGGTFIAMAYYEGENLNERIARGPMEVKDALSVVRQLATGLGKAHSRGIVHRDVKPANIILTPDGIVKIVDFGVAKLLGRTDITEEGATLGTAAYMAPEQVKGEPVDRRADIWALGAVLYEMLTGRQPFQGEYMQAVFYGILHEDPEPVETLREDISPKLAAIVGRCLEKDREKRFADIDSILEELRQLESEDSQQRLPRRRRIPVRALAAVLAGVLVLSAALVVFPQSRDTLFATLGMSGLPEARHLVVLPFRNVGGDAAGDAYCSGLFETLSSKLTQLERFSDAPFWVVPASEVLSRSVKSADQARRVFAANLVIDGSVHRSGTDVRLTLNLIDAATRRTLRSEVLDYTKSNPIAIQNSAIISIAEMLKLELASGATTVIDAGSSTEPGANDFYLQGRGYLNDFHSPENVDTAIRLFEQALREDSLYALAHAGLAEAYWRKFKSANDPRWVNIAVENANRALEIDAMLAPVHVTLGTTYTETGRYEEALQSYQKALEIDPLSADAYRGRARALELSGRPDDAEKTLKKAIDLRPSYWAGYNALGVFYYRSGRYEEAISQFLFVTKLTPLNAQGYQNLGGVYFALNRSDEAVAMFEKSLEIEPKFAVYSNLATYYYYEGRFEEAAKNYELALKLDDSDYRIWGNLAETYYWSRGGNEKARATYREAILRGRRLLEVNDQDAEVLARLSGYLARTGDLSEASDLLRRAVDTDPTEPELQFLIGNSYERIGERETAIDWIIRAIESGFPISEIERSPSLAQLRSDARYQQRLQNHSQTSR